MSKKVITLVATVVVIGALVGVLLYLQNAPAPEEPVASSSAPAPEMIYILGGPPADEPPAVVLVTVENEHGSYTLRNDKPDEPKNAENYTLLGFEGIQLDGYQVLGVADRATNLPVDSVVAENPEDLSAYGLDAPAASLRAEYADGTAAALLFGDSAPGSSGRYVMLEGEPKVYLLYESSAGYFLSSVFTMVDKVITLGDPAASVITKATLGGSVRPEEIVVEATPEDQTEVAGGMVLHTHAITAPTKSGLHSVRGLEPLMKVFALSATAVVGKVDEPSQLAQWGLGEPYSTIAIESPDDSFTLLAARPDADGNVNLMREGSPVVYQVPAESLPWLELDSFTMMDKMLLLPFIDTVDTVTVWTPEREAVIQVTGEDDELAVSVDGTPYADIDNFKTFYQTLISASYDTYTTDPLPAGATLLLRYTYTYRNGAAPSVVSFYEGASRRVFAQLNDDSPMYALSSYIDRVYGDLPKFLAGEELISYM